MHLKDNRIFYFDELRALAILLVLLAHTIQYFPVNMDYLTSPTLLSYLTVSRMGVPLFFMLSGALLIGKEYSLSSFFKKRFKRVLIPAIFWYIILFLTVAAANGYNFNMISYWIYQAPFPWFVCAIIGIYLVIPIFSSFIKEYGMKGAEYCLLIWFIIIVLTTFNLSENYYVELIFNNFGLYIGYAILGYYLTNKDFNIYSLPMMIFNLIAFIVTLSISIYYAFNYVNVVYIYSVSVIIQCITLFLFLRYLSKYALFKPKKVLSKVHEFIRKSWIGSLIYFLSISSYTIYLMHIHIVNLLLQYYPITTFDLIPAVYLLLVLGSIIVAFILSKIPILNRIVGVY